MGNCGGTKVVGIGGYCVEHYFKVKAVYFRIPANREVPGTFVYSHNVGKDMLAEDLAAARVLLAKFSKASYLGLNELQLYRQLREIV